MEVKNLPQTSAFLTLSHGVPQEQIPKQKYYFKVRVEGGEGIVQNQFIAFFATTLL